MSQIESLKEQARRHEQKEDWRRALDLYERAIDRLVAEDAPDIGLYNRVGDLYIRVGEFDAAVKAFEQAIELYVDSGLPNNAIAVCKKILRNVPDRSLVFLRMGQIRAEQGFLVDARTHFVTYAERMQAAGQLDDAVKALVEFADAAPEDVEMRLAIADHFEQRGHNEEAVGQLAAGYAASERYGFDDKVELFRERLAALRPDDDPAALVAAFAALDAGAEEPHEAPAADVADEDAGADEGWDFGDSQPLAEDVETAVETGPAMEGFESTALAAEVDEVGGALETAREEARTEDAVAEEPAEAGHEAFPSEVVAEVDEAFRRVEASNDPHGALVEFGEFAQDTADDTDPTEADGDEDLDVDLPFLHVPGDDDESATPAEEETSWVTYDPDELDVGTTDEDELHATTAEVDDPWSSAPAGVDADAAMNVTPVETDEPAAPVVSTPSEFDVDPLTEAPGVVDMRQRAVEEAHRSGDEAALVEAYVDLAEALRSDGSERRAQAILRQALQLNPDHARARAALDGAAPTERPVAEVASSEDYVDLGALILGDDDEKTTRFVVAYEEPSGDEQADFVKMLSQFKAKVAENVDASDVKAHHDLGTAYKEMGLLDEAVEEFQAALRASGDHLPTYEMLGQTFLDRGAPQAAVRVLSRALDVEFEVEDELLGIYYFLGRSHEECGNSDEAREFYERVFSLDINFADVTERLRALRG